VHFEYIVGGWPWQILGAIHTVVTAGEPGEIFLSGKQRTISPISCRPNFTKFEHNMLIGVRMKTFRTGFCKFYSKGSFFPKKQKFLKKIVTSCDLGSVTGSQSPSTIESRDTRSRQMQFSLCTYSRALRAEYCIVDIPHNTAM